MGRRSEKQNITSEEMYTLYHRRVEELLHLEIVNNLHWTRQRWKISWKEGSPLKREYGLPQRDLVRSFLLALRHFLADNEQISFYRVSKRIRSECGNQEITELVDHLRKDYSYIMSVPTVPIIINDHELKTTEIIDLFFNAELFHSDLEKLALLDMIRRNDLEGDYWYNLVTGAIRLFQVIKNLDTLIQNRSDEGFIQRSLAEFRKSEKKQNGA